jgi:hypothetical protein
VFEAFLAHDEFDHSSQEISKAPAQSYFDVAMLLISARISGMNGRKFMPWESRKISLGSEEASVVEFRLRMQEVVGQDQVPHPTLTHRTKTSQ